MFLGFISLRNKDYSNATKLSKRCVVVCGGGNGFQYSPSNNRGNKAYVLIQKQSHLFKIIFNHL
jgi:hypothetical protein